MVQGHFESIVKLADEVMELEENKDAGVAMLRAAFKLCPGCPLPFQGALAGPARCGIGARLQGLAACMLMRLLCSGPVSVAPACHDVQLRCSKQPVCSVLYHRRLTDCPATAAQGPAGVSCAAHGHRAAQPQPCNPCPGRWRQLTLPHLPAGQTSNEVFYLDGYVDRVVMVKDILPALYNMQVRRRPATLPLQGRDCLSMQADPCAWSRRSRTSYGCARGLLALQLCGWCAASSGANARVAAGGRAALHAPL